MIVPKPDGRTSLKIVPSGYVPLLDAGPELIAIALHRGAAEQDGAGEIAATTLFVEYGPWSLLQKPAVLEFVRPSRDGRSAIVDWAAAHSALTAGRLRDLGQTAQAALLLSTALGAGHPIVNLDIVLAQFDPNNALVVVRAMWTAMFHGLPPAPGWPPLPGSPQPAYTALAEDLPILRQTAARMLPSNLIGRAA